MSAVSMKDPKGSASARHKNQHSNVFQHHLLTFNMVYFLIKTIPQDFMKLVKMLPQMRIAAINATCGLFMIDVHGSRRKLNIKRKALVDTSKQMIGNINQNSRRGFCSSRCLIALVAVV